MKKILSAVMSVLLCVNIGIVGYAQDDKITCLDEKFAAYTGSGLPSGWKNYDEDGDSHGGDILSGTGCSDNALKITSTTAVHGAFKEFDKAIMPGRAFYVEFDIYSTAQSGFYMSFLGSDDVNKANSSALYEANAVIGMHTKQTSGSTGVSKVPALGYSSGTGGALTSFNASNCKISTGSWNHIKLTVAPVSETKTNLAVSVNNATEYKAEIASDLSTKAPSAIAFSAGKLARATANQYIAIDNISVYSFNSPPEVTGVSYWSDGERQSGTISVLTDKIEVNFDVGAQFADVSKSVSVVEKDTNTPLNCSVSLEEDGKKTVIVPREPMTAGKKYIIKVSDGYLPSSTLVMKPYEAEFVAVADEFKVSEIKYLAEDKEVQQVTTVTDTVKVIFTKKINTFGLADKIYIEDEENNKVNGIAPVVSNGKEAEMNIVGKLEGGKNYTLVIDGVETASFAQIKTSYRCTFGVADEKIHLESVKFADLNGNEYSDMQNIPYTLYSITAKFDKPVSERDIENKIYIKKGNGKASAQHTVSADGKTVSVALNDASLEKGESYTFVISSELSHKANENVLIESASEIDFTVSDELMYDTKVYFSEDFNDFTSNGSELPSGWHTVFNDVIRGGTNADNGSSGQKGDKSWRLGHDSIDARLLKPFISGETIPKGVPFIAEWDVNMMDDEQELRLSVLSEIDLEYHYSTGEGPYVYYENTNIGFFYNSSEGYTTVRYPNIARTSNDFTEFKDTSLKPGDDGYYLKMPKSGWHNIKLEIVPKSDKLTILNISIDGGKVYTAETPLDFYTFLPAGVCVWPFLGSEAMFDNIKVYTAQAVREPQLGDIVISDYQSNEYQTTDVIPVTATEIKVSFDTAINTSDIEKYIKLYCGSDEVECDYEEDILGQYVVVKPKRFLQGESTYKIEVLPGVKMKTDGRFALKTGIEKYFRTGEGEKLESLYNESLEITGDAATFSFDIAKYDNVSKEYIVIIADYQNETKSESGTVKTYKKLKKIKAESFSLTDNKTTNKSINLKCSNNSDYVCGCIISANDNTVVGGMLKSR